MKKREFYSQVFIHFIQAKMSWDNLERGKDFLGRREKNKVKN